MQEGKEGDSRRIEREEGGKEEGREGMSRSLNKIWRVRREGGKREGLIFFSGTTRPGRNKENYRGRRTSRGTNRGPNKRSMSKCSCRRDWYERREKEEKGHS
jgi:hypothetical protein